MNPSPEDSQAKPIERDLTQLLKNTVLCQRHDGRPDGAQVNGVLDEMTLLYAGLAYELPTRPPVLGAVDKPKVQEGKKPSSPSQP